MPINCVGLICLTLCLIWSSDLGMPTRSYEILVLLSSWILPIAILEATLLAHRQPDRGFSWGTVAPKPAYSGERTRFKLVGFYTTLLLVAMVYWVIPDYHRDYFDPFWNLLRVIGFAVVVGAIPYIYFVDAKSLEKEDSYLHFGRFLLGARREDDRLVLTQHLLGWGVKAFFLPLMTVFLNDNLNFFVGFDYSTTFDNFDTFFEVGLRYLFTIDIAIAGAGYLLTLRIFDAQIRSTEPTLLGWASALQCYPPFWTLIGASYLAYDADGYGWKQWLEFSEPAFIIWGSLILALTAIYSLCTVAFGLRFSNLTHRGIVTNGPYRYVKHPAYIAKNISWWLIAIPFIVDDGVLNSIRECLMLLALNGIYWLRAWTEERHLSRDANYRAYCDAIDREGFLAWTKRHARALRA